MSTDVFDTIQDAINDGMKSMEVAPKDGSRVFLYYKMGRIFKRSNLFWKFDNWYEHADDGTDRLGCFFEPIGWN